MTDTATQEKISYVYDTVGRPSETRTEKGDNIFRVLYGYDEISRPNSLIYKYNGAYTQKYSTSYIADNRITLFKLNNGQSDVFSIVPTFDTLGRQTSRTLKNGSGAQVEKEDYAFLAGAGGANASTSMVSSVGYYGSDSTVDETYTYTYDNLGNIKTVSKNGTQIAAYTYNSFNMLTGYTDADGNTYTYGYSSGKNISETGKYLLFYTDDVWLDRVTCITDDASGKVFGITYDGIGNTLSYRDGMSFTWKNGRQLATFTQGQTSASYDYNESGIRNKKTVNGVTTTFQLAGSMIVSENRNGNIIQYYYNEAGSVIGLRYNGNDYFFRRNLQGDIIAILNTAGQTVVSYEYDPWGNILSTSGSLASTLGVANPFRYRGYYYDTESGLYYLQTRYYDAAVGRFINADGFTSTGQGFLGNNMYAYCLNNPISYTDPSGRASRRVFVESQTEGAIIFQESIGNPERIPVSKRPIQMSTYGNNKGKVYALPNNKEIIDSFRQCITENDIMFVDKRDNISVVDGERVQDPDYQVIDSYRITDESEMQDIINSIRDYDRMFPSPYVWDRTDESIIYEWKLHNFAYKFAYSSEDKERARHADFNNIDENRGLISYIFGGYFG